VPAKSDKGPDKVIYIYICMYIYISMNVHEIDRSMYIYIDKSIGR